MKKINIIILLIFTFLVSCEKDNDTNTLTDGFCISFGDKYILSHLDIDYYDYSTHLVYLKNGNSFLNNFESGGGFKVYADKKEIYTGTIHPAYSSFLPSSPVIHSHPYHFQDYIISIDFIQRFDSTGNIIPDIRENESIVQALKNFNQFHVGLSSSIESLEYYPEDNKVIIQLQLQNYDSFDYYYLDPKKMGMELFHYFTNGLQIKDFNNKRTYTHKTASNQPEPWDSWNKEWLSVIKSNENKLITITYNGFDTIPGGEYKAFFKFPGLTYQVDKENVQQEKGRIWLGETQTIKEINIE